MGGPSHNHSSSRAGIPPPFKRLPCNMRFSLASSPLHRLVWLCSIIASMFDKRTESAHVWFVLGNAERTANGRERDGRAGDAHGRRGEEIRPDATNRRRISRSTARRARSLYLWRARQGRDDASRVPQYRADD